MSAIRRIAALAALLGAGALAGCGNSTDQGLVAKAVLSGLKPKPKVEMTPEQVNAAVAASLSQTDLPLALASLEGRQATVILANIESNGPYRTWGSSDRRTIITRDGIVTATRGLGSDIMSSSVGEVGPLVTARKTGAGRHVKRYLDGENHTQEQVANCQVTRGAAQRVSGGTLSNVAATEMVETCSVAGGESFTNSYVVDGRGRVLKSRQWLGEANGYIVLQVLR